MSVSNAQRVEELRVKKICRFCLTQQPEKLASIYSRDIRVKASASLQLQIMAIASIEVDEKENMPSSVCTDCRILFEHCYRFKQMCKEADTLLRQFPLTGKWPAPLEKPRTPIVATAIPQTQPIRKIVNINSKQGGIRPQRSAATKSGVVVHNSPRKLLNSAPVATPEPPIPLRLVEKKEEHDATSVFLNKVENGEDFSLDDLRLLLSENTEEQDDASTQTVAIKSEFTNKPKLLNKPSIRILNKEASVLPEPRLRKPQITRDEDGNMAIVTEIIDPSEPYEPEPEPDPIKNVEPVETNVFACTQCDRSFPLRQLRDIHMVNHNRERSFKCSDCEKSFFSKYDLQKHSLVHSGVKPYKCSVCEKAFTRAALLHRHEKTHTDIPKFICLYCEKPFISSAEMEKHTERHQKNRPFQCKICNKSFAFKQGLERHELLHSSDLPFPCEYCSMSFFTAGKLARHLTAHAGKRAYPCKFCSKSYLLSHHLSRHMRSHRQGTSPFSCSVCQNVFKNYDELIAHSTQHATETLQCPLCKERIDGPENIRMHFKAHTDGDTFACEFCDLIFMSSTQLKIHSSKEHTVEMVPYQKTDTNSISLEDVELFDDLITEDTDLLDENLTAEQEIQPPTAAEKITKPRIISQVVITPEKSHTDGLPPSKIRKTTTDKDKKPVALEADTASSAINSLKRKKPVPTTTTTSSKPMKSEKVSIVKVENVSPNPDKTTSITSMLKALPKGVSVRRSTQKALTSPGVKQTSPMSTTSAAEKETRTTRSSHDTRSSNGKPPLGDVTSPELEIKQPKIHRLTISRKEADAMVKDGRLVLKNGAMVLTRTKENSK